MINAIYDACGVRIHEIPALPAKIKAGLDLIAVGWGFRTREELLLSGAKRIFSSPEEVEAFLLGQ